MNKWRYIIALFSVFIYLMAFDFNPELATNFSYSVIILGLLIIGIPHGAIDHLLQKDKKQSLFKFILKYLIIVVIYFVTWQYFPLLSLIVFILYSSFHFGESELQEIDIHMVSIWSYFRALFLGLSILLFIIFTHSNESLQIASQLSGYDFENTFKEIFISSRLYIILLSIVFIVWQIIITKKRSLIALIVLLLIGTQVPLIFAFSLYFIGQHSYNAWMHIKHSLSTSYLSLYKNASPFTLGALFIFVAIYFYGKFNLEYLKSLSSNFFIFLACISLPHFVLMHLFYKKQ